jgi:hypothetical protein
MVLVPDHGTQLELRCRQGGISLAAPPRPKPQLQSVPPILRRQHQNSMPGYSKGAQGLSVYVRVTGIFTGTTDSPSALRRQCPNRYAIRAGRNLPDKEFRLMSYFLIRESGASELMHPACRHAVGTISLPGVPGIRRMVSEDSDEFCSGFLPVHARREFEDPNQSLRSLVNSRVHLLHGSREQLEIEPLRRP